jgi:hypothetical protein
MGRPDTLVGPVNVRTLWQKSIRDFGKTVSQVLELMQSISKTERPM